MMMEAIQQRQEFADTSFYSEVMTKQTWAHAQSLESMSDTSSLSDGECTYTHLGASHLGYTGSSAESDLFSMSEEPMDLRSWTRVHPHSWSPSDVLQWMYHWAKQENRDNFSIRGENFSDVTGRSLCSMSRKEIAEREPMFGNSLYECLQELLRKADFQPPCDILADDASSDPTLSLIFEGMARSPKYLMPSETELDSQDELMPGADPNLGCLDDTDGQQEALLLAKRQNEALVDIDGSSYDYDPQDPMTEFFGAMGPGHESGYATDSASELSDKQHYTGYSHANIPTTVPATLNSPEAPEAASVPPYVKTEPCLPPCRELLKPKFYTPAGEQPKDKQPPKRRPGRPPKPRCPGDVNYQPQQTSGRGRKQGQGTRGNHLWEFMRDLLKSAVHNPSIIRWEDSDQGVFKIINSKRVAELWGIKKNNPAMTFEKLSRAIRFCRTQSFFDNVPKTGKFPKKLCFKFGAKAYGWQKDYTGGH